MTILEFIKRWELSGKVLSREMGMNSRTFYNKLSSKHPTQFTPDEITRLGRVIARMYIDWGQVRNELNLVN